MEEFLKAAQNHIHELVQQSYCGKVKHKAGKISLCNDKVNRTTDLNHKLRVKLNANKVENNNPSTEVES
jgi:hypothetical protein